MDKQALKRERRRKVRWTRGGEQWSSAVEPDLSPITGSSGDSTPRKAEKSTETVIRATSGRSCEKTETTESSLSTARPTRKMSASSSGTGTGHAIRRKHVPIRSRTLSSSRSYSDLIPVESEFTEPLPPPPPPKDELAPVR